VLVRNAALHRHVVAEHLPYGFPEPLRSVDHEQQPLLDVEPAVHEIGQQRGGDGRVLARPVPQPERELVALRRDPQRDDVGAAVQLDPVEHDHRQAQVGERAVELLPGHILHLALDCGDRSRCGVGVDEPLARPPTGIPLDTETQEVEALVYVHDPCLVGR